MKKIFPLPKVYCLLEPGPVVLLTTAYRGRANIMTMSWHTMIDFEPPTIGCIISNRNYSFNNLIKTKECVINVPTLEIAKKVVGCGNTSGSKVDKFEKFQLTPVPAACIKPPLIKECYANLECQVIDMRMVNKYNLFILEVIKAWIGPSIKHAQTLHHQGRGNFMVGAKWIKVPSKMK